MEGGKLFIFLSLLFPFSNYIIFNNVIMSPSFPKPKSPNTFCTYVIRPMSRRKVTLRLNSDVVERAKNAGINFSYFLEVKLVEYLALLNVTPRRRFELLLPSRRTGFQGRRVRPDFATSAYGYN